MDSDRPIWKIGVVGERGVGKTSLINRLVFDSFQDSSDGDYDSHFVKKKFVCEGNEIELLFLEIDPHTLSPKKITGTKAVVFLSDVTDEKTLEDLEYLARDVYEINQKTNFIFLGNKCDLKYNAKFWLDDIKNIAKNYKNSIYGVVSARTGENITPGLNFVCKKILNYSKSKT